MNNRVFVEFLSFFAKKVWKMEGKLDPFSNRIFGFQHICGSGYIGFLKALFDCVLNSRKSKVKFNTVCYVIAGFPIMKCSAQLGKQEKKKTFRD